MKLPGLTDALLAKRSKKTCKEQFLKEKKGQPAGTLAYKARTNSKLEHRLIFTWAKNGLSSPYLLVINKKVALKKPRHVRVNLKSGRLYSPISPALRTILYWSDGE